MVHQIAGVSREFESAGFDLRMRFRRHKSLPRSLVVIAMGTLQWICGAAASAQPSAPVYLSQPGNNPIQTRESDQHPADKLAELGVEAFQE